MGNNYQQVTSKLVEYLLWKISHIQEVHRVEDIEDDYELQLLLDEYEDLEVL